jgi:TonB-linked SusC/RagA family outer membrane protein
MWAQTRTVTGKITDENNEPIPSATVIVPGTTNGTVTDVDGNFSLEVDQNTQALQITYLGMKDMEVSIVGKNTINVQMETETIGLEEVVAIGYGSVKRKDLTGATSSVTSEELTQDRALTNLEDALKGKISGVRIIQNSGGPAAQSTVMIRGATSVSGDNQPLYIVDGFPVENFDLNADDVETIDVLKDAASTAIYGSRGANGVIIVSTKKGKKGQPRIEVTAKYGISNLASEIDMIDNVEYIKQTYGKLYRYTKASDWSGDPNDMQDQLNYFQDVEGNIWTAPKYDFEGNPHPYINHEIYRDSTNTNWQDAALRTANFQDYRLNFSSGTDRSTYNLTLNFVDEEGLIPNNKVQKMIGRFNMTQKLTERLMIISNTYYTRLKNMGYSGITNRLLQRPPIQPVSGDYTNDNIPGFNETGLVTNPIELTKVVDRNSYTPIFQSNLTFDFDITQKLNLNIGGSYRELNTQTKNYTPSTVLTGNGFTYNGVAQFVGRNYKYAVSNNVLTYTDSFNDHDLTVMLGNSVEWDNNEVFRAENRNFEIETLDFYGFEGGTEPQVPSVDFIETALVSYFGRFNYNFKDKYLLKGTVRADASSKFAENNKWGYFPSLAGAWRLSEENFAKSISGFPNTKIRASWGIAGKQSIDPYQSLSVFGATTGTIDGESMVLVAYPLRLANADLEWEKNEEINLGIDLVFSRGRYNFTADIYRKTTDGMLLDIPTPGYTGYTERTINFGELQNQGIELQADAILVRRPFRWKTTFNITFVESKVLEVGEQGYLNIPNGILEEGQPIGVWFGYEQEGVWQSQAEIDEAIENGFVGQHGIDASTIQPGHTKFVDQLTVDTDDDNIPDANDGVIDANDRVRLGKSRPDFTGGFYNTFSWKGLSLNIGLQYSYGANVFNENRIGLEQGRGYPNQAARTADRWVPTLYSYDPENPSEKTLLREGNNGNLIRIVGAPVETQLVDRYIEDGSFIRLSDLSLAYNFPKQITNKLDISNLRIFINGQNLKLWTNYSGYDPEVNTGQYKSLLPGLDSGAYPRASTIVFGVKLTL